MPKAANNIHKKAEGVSASAADRDNPPTGAPGRRTYLAEKATVRHAPTKTDDPSAKAVPTARADPKERDRNKDVQAAAAGGRRSPNSEAPSRRGPDFKFGFMTGTNRGTTQKPRGLSKHCTSLWSGGKVNQVVLPFGVTGGFLGNGLGLSGKKSCAKLGFRQAHS